MRREANEEVENLICYGVATVVQKPCKVSCSNKAAARQRMMKKGTVKSDCTCDDDASMMLHRVA